MSKNRAGLLPCKLIPVVVVALVLALVLPVSLVLADGVVTFPDPNLEAAIRSAIGKPTGDIYQSDLDGLAQLHAPNKNIVNITGLEDCTSLTLLDLSSNQISDISPLADLTGLTELYLYSNQISDISPLGNLTDLTELWLVGNQISDISSLANLTSLISLELGANQLSDISPLADLTSLTELYLYSNQLSDISSLANLTSLTSLELGANQLSDISPLADLTSLTELYLYSNQLSDISPLTNLISLTKLNLEWNQLSDISPLADLTSLTRLYLGWNQISDISPLVDNLGLGEGDWVDLRDNPLSDDSLNIYIPQLEARGVTFLYDARRQCFIATAAYGTPMAEEIQVLRECRDRYLLTNAVGQAFVDFYYRVSPPVARFITEHPSLKQTVRAGLIPAVAMSAVVVNTTPAEKAVIVALLALVSVAGTVCATRRRGRGPEFS